MKRIILSVILVVLLISVVSVSAMATVVDEGTIDNTDFTESYIWDKSNGAVTLRYNPWNFWLSARASTDVSVARDQSGMAAVELTAVNGEVAKCSNINREGNVINSGKATVSNQFYAKRVVHSAWRVTDGVLAEYYYRVN